MLLTGLKDIPVDAFLFDRMGKLKKIGQDIRKRIMDYVQPF